MGANYKFLVSQNVSEGRLRSFSFYLDHSFQFPPAPDSEEPGPSGQPVRSGQLCQELPAHPLRPLQHGAHVIRGSQTTTGRI